MTPVDRVACEDRMSQWSAIHLSKMASLRVLAYGWPGESRESHGECDGHQGWVAWDFLVLGDTFTAFMKRSFADLTRPQSAVCFSSRNL